jgi:hypothetical protein
MNREIYHQILWRLGIEVSDAGPGPMAAELASAAVSPTLPAPGPTVALRSAYRQWFRLTVEEADGRPIDRAAARALHQQIVRLTDEAGSLWADALFADELRRFRADTARCGLCGGLGHAQEKA